MITDEELMSFVDGEANPELIDLIEAQLEIDPDLRLRLDQMSGVTALVREAFAPVLDRPVPEHLAQKVEALVRAAEQPAPGARIIQFPTSRIRPRSWAVPSAIAAALVMGVLLGRTGLPMTSQADWLTEPGRESPVAGKPIAIALSRTPSGQSRALSEGRQIIPMISFKTAQGDLCRQFRFIGPQDTHSGVACRGEQGQWRLVALTVGESLQGNGYETAAGPGEDPVSMMVDRMIAGEPLDAKAEAETLGLPNR